MKYMVHLCRITLLISFVFNTETFGWIKDLGADCCLTDKITEEDKAIEKEILKHLKLETEEGKSKLEEIVSAVNNSENNIEKLGKIIKSTKDIDWEKPKYPKTLIKWYKCNCALITYLDLMLNNPYFLKFFLICKQINSLHTDDTYILNGLCDFVEWCVTRPSFYRRNKVSIDGIMDAVFKKNENGDFFYGDKVKNDVSKNDNNNCKDLLAFYYIVNQETNEYIPNPECKYGNYQEEDFYQYVIYCLFLDLKIGENKQITNELKKIFFYEKEQDIKFRDEEYISNTFTTNNSARISNNKKLLGLFVFQGCSHFYSIVNYNGEWYNKNTRWPLSHGKVSQEGLEKELKERLKKDTPSRWQWWQINKKQTYFVYLPILQT
jgi:hypothetical protein